MSKSFLKNFLKKKLPNSNNTQKNFVYLIWPNELHVTIWHITSIDNFTKNFNSLFLFILINFIQNKFKIVHKGKNDKKNISENPIFVSLH